MDDKAKVGGVRFRMSVANAVVEVRALHQGVRRLCEDYLIGAGFGEAEVARGFGEAAGAPAPGGVAGDAAVCEARPGGVAAGGAAAGFPAPADLVVSVTQADIDAERECSTDEHSWSDAYLETLAVLRRIAEWAPQHRRLLVHGAAIQYDGRAYLFTAPSGTGKSTHIKLWRRYLGAAVRVVNGDKPFVLVPEAPDAAPVAYGTPWSGKEGWQENATASLAGICLLSRAEPGATRIDRIPAADALDRIIRQVYLPPNALAAANALELLDALLARVPVYDLAVDMSEGAVRTSFEALTGLPYRPAI